MILYAMFVDIDDIPVEDRCELCEWSRYDQFVAPYRKHAGTKIHRIYEWFIGTEYFPGVRTSCRPYTQIGGAS